MFFYYKENIHPEIVLKCYFPSTLNHELSWTGNEGNINICSTKKSSNNKIRKDYDKVGIWRKLKYWRKKSKVSMRILRFSAELKK